MNTNEVVLKDTINWVERAVIGLNLCPFAKAVQSKGLVHYVVSQATDEEAVVQALLDELEALMQCSDTVRDTTLLIIPYVWNSFEAFNDFCDLAQVMLVQCGYEGTLQIAHFHPQFTFEGEASDDMSHYTNRAPYPILHLIREDSIERAVAAYPNPESIYGRNIEKLRELGIEGWKKVLIGE